MTEIFGFSFTVDRSLLTPLRFFRLRFVLSTDSENVTPRLLKQDSDMVPDFRKGEMSPPKLDFRVKIHRKGQGSC